MQFFETEKEKLTKINNDYKKLCELLTYEEVLIDKKLFLNYQKQKNILHPIALKYQKFLQLNKNLQELEAELENLTEYEKKLFLLDLKTIREQIEDLKIETKQLLNNYNSVYSSVIVDVNPDKDSNSLKLQEFIIKGYNAYCKANNLSCDTETQNKKTTLKISGYNAKEFFKNEVGLHSCQAGGTCQVFVYQTFEKDGFDESDVTFQTCRSSGAGGQHVNTTDSAIKAIHLKTGLTAISQDERSQFQNKQKALERLKQKVDEFCLKNQQKNIESQKKEQFNLIKNNFVAKTYDFENGKIIKSNKQTILIKDFLQGKEL